MPSKIIKLKPLAFELLKPGGGGVELKPPSTITNLHLLLKQLSELKYFAGARLFSLTHLSHNKEGAQTPIPAPSRRFINAMQTIFGSTVFTYESTRFNYRQNKLEFLYLITFRQIVVACERLKVIVSFYESIKSNDESWANMFIRITSTDQQAFALAVEELKARTELKLLAKTRLVELLTSQFHYFKALTPDVEEVIITNENEQGNLKFASLEALTSARDLLVAKNAQITFFNEDERALELNFDGAFRGVVTGALSASVSLKTVELGFNRQAPLPITLEKALYDQFRLTSTELNHVKVGVIDGGFSSDSILLNDIIYDDNVSLGFSQVKPQGSHAESVVSLLLWTNKLNSNIANDFSTAPTVHLFNVVDAQENVGTLKTKVQAIVAKFHHEIKVWNFSCIAENIKQAETLSELCVFFDYIQRKYGVLFVLATGNRVGDNEYIAAPAGSFRGIAVAATDIKGRPASYALTGGGQYINFKPDLAIFGGDEARPLRAIAFNAVTNVYGTSFATPLVTRKVAQLVSEGFSLNAIPAILLAFASYHVRNNSDILPHSQLGFGTLPVDARVLFAMVNNKGVIVLDQAISGAYSQGFFKLKMPKISDQYDQSFYLAFNVDAELERNATYEYVRDCTRFIFGRVNPFAKSELYAESQSTLDSEEGMDESSLRVYKGKFKTRGTFKEVIKHKLWAAIRRHANEVRAVDYWGIKLVRNLIDGDRKKKLAQQVALCLIIESKYNTNFYEQFIALNSEIVQDIDLLLTTQVTTDIEFT